ncbi:MAG: peptide chain release factor N(5)-glutamine methyltransferase [Candidatus Rokuibacteriota bacterium]
MKPPRTIALGPPAAEGGCAAPRPTIRQLLETSVARLEAAGIDTPRVDAEWLLADALGVRRLALHGLLDRRLSAEAVRGCRDRVRRRAAREPLQHVLGWEDFRGIRLRVTRDVLVPRPETEMLVEWALELLPRPGPQRRLAVDLGTGSGCIACALALERSDVDVVAVDVSSRAAAIAASNVEALGLRSRVRVVVSDLFAGLRARPADLVVANPPYLPSALVANLAPEVRDGDPRLALDGGPDGLALTRRIAAAARGWLRRGAVLVLETAGGPAADTAVGLLRAGGYVDVRSRADLAGVTRFVAGRMA